MYRTRSAWRRPCAALAPAAGLLLALCLLAGGVQALTDPPALVVNEPGLYTLDHDISTDAMVGVLINGSDVVFDGMGHTIAGTGANGSVGVLVSGRTTIDGDMGANVTVRNVTVSDWSAGIGIAETSDTVVDRVIAEQNGNGLTISPTTGIASGHVVRNSVFRENTGAGIDLSYPAEGITVERCTIAGNGVGISAFEISHGAPNTLADSEISGNADDGLNSQDGGFGVVRNCTIGENGGDGLEFEHGGAEVVGCHIEDNAAAGVRATDRGGSDIHGNRITGNGEGVLVGGDWPSSVRNNYFNNTDNGFFGQAAGPMNYEKTAGENIVGGPYLGGNFWANPNGTGFSQTHADADHDGICDEPYVVNPEEGVTDHLPLAPAPGTPVTTPAPFKDHPVPGRIEAEDYDLGGESVAYHDTTPGNLGGAYRHDDVDIEPGGSNYDVGWIRDGEFLMYTVNVSQAGFYTMTASVASPNYDRSATISVNANPMYSIRFPNTGSFATYATATGDDVYLPAGTSTLRLTFNGDGENLDWFELAPQSSDTPTPYKPLTIPGTIQAEDYDLGGEGVAYHDTTPGNEGGTYRHDDVDIESAGGVTDVGWIRDGEWLVYSVNVTGEGPLYEMTASVASPNSGRTIDLSIDGAYAETIAVPNTGSFSTFRPVTVTISLAKTPHTLTLLFHGDGQNLDSISFAPAGGPGPQPNGTPYKPLAIPGRIEAEDYDLGGEGVAYHDTTPGNEGGAYRHDDVDIEVGGSNYDVGWIRNGEYLTYTATVATAGEYAMGARVASPNSGRTIAVSVDGTAAATIMVPNTGSFETFRTVVVPVPLVEGTHTLKLAFTGDGQNLDWVTFGTQPITPEPSGGASFAAAPLTAPHGSAVTFTVTPAAGKTISVAWWSFDATAHLNTWNSRAVNPTFFYPSAGTFSPLVKITYTDGSSETVERAGYIQAT